MPPYIYEVPPLGRPDKLPEVPLTFTNTPRSSMKASPQNESPKNFNVSDKRIDPKNEAVKEAVEALVPVDASDTQTIPASCEPSPAPAATETAKEKPQPEVVAQHGSTDTVKTESSPPVASDDSQKETATMELTAKDDLAIELPVSPDSKEEEESLLSQAKNIGGKAAACRDTATEPGNAKIEVESPNDGAVKDGSKRRAIRTRVSRGTPRQKKPRKAHPRKWFIELHRTRRDKAKKEIAKVTVKPKGPSPTVENQDEKAQPVAASVLATGDIKTTSVKENTNGLQERKIKSYGGSNDIQVERVKTTSVPATAKRTSKQQAAAEVPASKTVKSGIGETGETKIADTIPISKKQPEKGSLVADIGRKGMTAVITVNTAA
ncbi:hypothetical protein FN846DRAFT_989949 [Sphaerosporella brunnea]|uniref:Uncharacterized protein n=1 Tax=Sphaerosporella brunnea TaxID=1250544 RepID=A0A5J5EQF5_9PEZI|nr:hypothetical protein FN846DRAFT_989949 [Sphaerosporella brunnea]